ncbi:chemotaxis protein CheW [Brasilonema bromeliae]|uniref:CheW-like domain-containing protein n=1 Tax=Brasilonema bromeliae SPC951 TaxID=385972 RepID=A0ABX1PAE8_9CYAN|nr:chemotaxis protein CheW [Brasilonema bromeliae]NMG20767.1 hypothetical protein [Brasilonema bromeliae SPC951]
MHNESQLDKFLVFKIADYLLALPITDVLKVINFSSANSKSLPTMGLVQIGQYIIKILDLHQHLGSDTFPHSSDHPFFLVVAHHSQQELCGILIDEPPDIVELLPETIRFLPRSSNHSKPLIEMVSHVAVLSEQEVVKTIFLLDLKRIAEPV